ncbi:MAG: cytochrome P450 [Verrucomicrobiota bacterium]
MVKEVAYFPGDKLVRHSKESSKTPIQFRGYTAESFLEAYREAGSVFTTEVNGETFVILSGLDANEVAWRTPDNWSYGQAVAVFREELSELHLTQLDREPHRRKRRLLNKGFKNSSVMSSIAATAETIQEGLAAIEGKEVESHHELMKMLTRAQARSSVKAVFSEEEIERMVDFEEGFIGALFMKRHERELIYNRASYLDVKNVVLTQLHEIVKARLERDDPEDLLDEVIQQKTSSAIDPLSEEELIYDTYLLLIAGTGNTSKLTSYLLHALSLNPEWTARLREEIGDFDAHRLAEGMKHFPLLKATLLETERMFPAAPVLPRVPAQDIEFLGYPIGAGTNCLHLASLMHFDNSIYEEPFVFNPGRWLDHNYPRNAHGTFGGGSHTCIGMNLVRIQMPLILGYLLSGYDYEITSPPEMENYAYPGEVDSKTLRMGIRIKK